MEEDKQPTADTNNGDKPAAASLIEQADAARKGLEESLKRREELLKQEQEFETRRILSGRSEAGIAPKKVDPEQELKDRVNAMLEKTGFKPWR